MNIAHPPLDLSALLVDDVGTGRPMLLLHGGGGPATVRDLGLALAAEARVLTPTHPGFGGTGRPAELDNVAALAAHYLHMLVERGLNDVVLIGSSIGGWIAAEMAIQNSRRLGALVLLNPVGISTPDAVVKNVAGLSREALVRLASHDADRVLANTPPATPERLAQLASNGAALTAYDHGAGMMAAGLRERLSSVTVPALVLWGVSDGIAPPAYGRAYAAAFGNGGFEEVVGAGHLPHIEQPAHVLAAIRRFLDDHA